MNETLAPMLPANRSLDPSTCIPPTISASSSGGGIAPPTSAPNHRDALPMTDSGSSQTAESSTWVRPSDPNIVSVFENSERALHASTLLSATLSASAGVLPPSTSLPMDNSLSASLASSALLSLAASPTSSASYHSRCFLATASHPIAAAPVAAPSLSSSSSSSTPSASDGDVPTSSKPTSTLATAFAAPTLLEAQARAHRHIDTSHPPEVPAIPAALAHAHAPHLYPRLYASHTSTLATSASALVGSPDPALHDDTDAASALPSPPHAPSLRATVTGASPAAARALSDATTLPRSGAGVVRARALEHAHAAAHVLAAGAHVQDSVSIPAPAPKRARLQGQPADSAAAAPAMLPRLSSTTTVTTATEGHAHGNGGGSSAGAHTHTHAQQTGWAMLAHSTSARAHAPYAAARARQRSPGSDDEDPAASFFVPVPGSHPPAETMASDGADAASALFRARVWPRDAAAVPTPAHATHAQGPGAAAPALVVAVRTPTPAVTTTAAHAHAHAHAALERSAPPPSLRVDVAGLDAPSRRAATLSACAADPPRAPLPSLPRAETAAPTLTAAASPHPGSPALPISSRNRRSRSLSPAALLPPHTHAHTADSAALPASASGEMPTATRDACAHAQAHAEVHVHVDAVAGAHAPAEETEDPSSLLRVFGKRSEAARSASLAAGTPALTPTHAPALTPAGAASPLHAAAPEQPAGVARDFTHPLPLSLSQPGASLTTCTALDCPGPVYTPASAALTATHHLANADTPASAAPYAADMSVDMGTAPATTTKATGDLPVAVPVEVPVHTTHTSTSPSASLSAPPRAYTALSSALSSDASFTYPALPAPHPRGDASAPQLAPTAPTAQAVQAAFTAAQAAAQALSQALSPQEAAEAHYAAYAAYAALVAVSDLPATAPATTTTTTATASVAHGGSAPIPAVPAATISTAPAGPAIPAVPTLPSAVHAMPAIHTTSAVSTVSAVAAAHTPLATVAHTTTSTRAFAADTDTATQATTVDTAAVPAPAPASAHASHAATALPTLPTLPSLPTALAAFTAPAPVAGDAATQLATHNLAAGEARTSLTNTFTSPTTSPTLASAPYAHAHAHAALSLTHAPHQAQALPPSLTHTQMATAPPVLASPASPTAPSASAELSPDALLAADTLRAALGVPFPHLSHTTRALSSATPFPYADPAHPHAAPPQRPPAALHEHVPLARLPQMYLSLTAQPAHAWMGPAFQRLWLLTASCELAAATADALTSPLYHCLSTANLRAVVARAGHSGFVCDPLGWLSRFLQRRLWGLAHDPAAAAHVPALASVAQLITSQPLQCMTVAPPHQVTSIMQPTRTRPRTPALPIPYAGELTFACLPPGLVFTCPRTASAVAPHIELAAHSRSRSRTVTAASGVPPSATSRRGRAVRASARAGHSSVEDEDELAMEDSPLLTFTTPAASAEDEVEVDAPRTTAAAWATWAAPLQTPLLGTHTIAAARSLLRQALTAHQTAACADMLSLLAPATVAHAAHARARAPEALAALPAQSTDNADTATTSPSLAPRDGSPAMGEAAGAGAAPSPGDAPLEHRVIAWHQAVRHLLICGQLTDARFMSALTAVVPSHSAPDVAFARLLRPWLQCVPTCVGETLESDVFGQGDDGGQTSRRAIIHTGQVELRQWFMEAPKPSKSLVSLIANTLMLPTKTVYRWFRNERYASARRDKGDEEDGERQDGEDMAPAAPATTGAGSRATKTRGRKDAAAAAAEPARDEEETEAQQQAMETQLHTRQAERRDAVTFDTHIRTQLLYLLQLCEVYHPALLELMPLLGAVEADHVRRSLASLVPDELLDTLRPNGRTTGALQPFVDYMSPLLRSLAGQGYDTAALNAGVGVHACVNKYEWTSAQEKAAFAAPKQQRRSKKRKNAQQVNAEVRRAVNETCVLRLTIIRKVMEQVHAARTLCPSLAHYLQALCAVAVHTSGDSEALREVSRSAACEWEPAHVLSLANSLAAMRAGAPVALASTISIAAQSSAAQVMASLARADAWPQAAFSELIAAGVLSPSAIPADSTMLPPPLPHAHAGVGAHTNACGSGNYCSGTCSLVPILLMHAVQQVVPAAAPRVREVARVQQQLYLFEACATADLWAEHIASCPAPRACGVSLDAVGTLWDELSGALERVENMDAASIAAELAAEGGTQTGDPDTVPASIDLAAAAVATYTASQAPPVPSSWAARDYRPPRPAVELARSPPFHRPEPARTAATQRAAESARTALRGGGTQRGSGPRTRGGGRQHAAMHAHGHAEDAMEDADELPHGSSLPAPPTLPALPPLPTLPSLAAAATPAPTCFPSALSEAGTASAQLRGLHTAGTVTQSAGAQPSLLTTAMAAALAAAANVAIAPPPSMHGSSQAAGPTQTPIPTQPLLHAATTAAGALLHLGEVSGGQVGPDSLIATAAARLATYASTSPAASPVPAFMPPQQQPAPPAPYSYLGPAALSAASSHAHAPAHTAAPATAPAAATAPASALTPLLGAKQLSLQPHTYAHALLPASARAAPPALLPSALPASSAQHAQSSLPLIAPPASAPALLPVSAPAPLAHTSASTSFPAATPTPTPAVPAVCATAPTPAPLSATASSPASATASTAASPADALCPPDSLLAPCSLPSLASLTSLAHEHAAYMYSQAAPHSTPARPADSARAHPRADAPLAYTPLPSRQSSVRVPPPFTPTPAPPASLSFAAVTAPLHMALPSTTSYNTTFTVPRPPVGTLPDADGDLGPRSWVAAAAGDALMGLMGMAAVPPSQHRWLASSTSSAGMGSLTALAAAPSCGSPPAMLSHTNMFGSPPSRLASSYPAHTPAGVPTPSPAQAGAGPRLRSAISSHSFSRGLASPPSALPQFLPGGTPTTSSSRAHASHGMLSPALLGSSASASVSAAACASAGSSLPLRATLALRTRGYGAPPLQPPTLTRLGSGSNASASAGTSGHTSAHHGLDAAFFLAATPIPASMSTSARDADGTGQQLLQPQALSRRTSPTDAQDAQAQANKAFAVPRPRFPYTPNVPK